MPERQNEPCGRYEPPRIVSASRHFIPDNSGTCCPICGSQGDNDFGYGCSECPPNTREWYGAKMYDFAKTVSEGMSLCGDDTYSLRKRDGIGTGVCILCLTRKHDIAKLRFCNDCGFFVEGEDWQDGACRWCRELGWERSVRISVPKVHWPKPPGLRGIFHGKAEKELWARAQGWSVEGTWERRRGAGKPMVYNNKYEKLVAQLDTPEMRPVFARFLVSGKGFDPIFEELALDKFFQRLGISYYSRSSYIAALYFIARNEGERFARDPAMRELYKSTYSEEALRTIDNLLRTGSDAHALMGAIAQVVEGCTLEFDILPWVEPPSDPWGIVRETFPQIPRALLCYQYLNGGLPDKVVQEVKAAGYTELCGLHAELDKAPSLALALSAWGFWHHDGTDGPAPADWSLDILRRTGRKLGCDTSGCLELARAYSEGEGAGEWLPGPLRDRLAGLPDTITDAGELSAFMGDAGKWGDLARLLARRKVACRPRTSDIAILLRITACKPELQKEFDDYIWEQVEAGGRLALLRRMRMDFELGDFLRRTGRAQLLEEL